MQLWLAWNQQGAYNDEANQELLDADYDRLIAQVRILSTMGKLLQSLQLSLPAEASIAQK